MSRSMLQDLVILARAAMPGRVRSIGDRLTENSI